MSYSTDIFVVEELGGFEVDFVLGVTDPPAGGVGRSDMSDLRI